MISNYSHDHIALDTMNIMANGQYIDINIDINIEYHYYTYSQSKQARKYQPIRMLYQAFLAKHECSQG